MPAVAFPAEAGTHLSTPLGWKAEVALHTEISVRHQALNSHTVAHLSTNRTLRNSANSTAIFKSEMWPQVLPQLPVSSLRFVMKQHTWNYAHMAKFRTFDPCESE